MHIHHRSPTPPPSVRAPLPSSPPVPHSDALVPARTPSQKKVSFAALPDLPQAVSPTSAPSAAMVRLMAFFNPTRTAAELVLGELEVRHGINGELAEEHIADLEAALQGLGLDAAVRSVLAKFENDTDLSAVASFFENDTHANVAEKLAVLTPMLRQLAQMPPGQAPEVKHKDSKTCDELLEKLLPELLEDAPKDLMIRAIKDELSRSERKEALTWLSDPSYPVAARIEMALDKKLSKLCLSHEMLDKALAVVAPLQIKSCDEILAVSPDDLVTRRLRAHMLGITGETKRALEDFDVVLKKDIDGHDYFARGMLRLNSGHKRSGLRDMERALSLSISSSDVYAAYLHAYVEHGDRPARRGLCALALGENEVATKAFEEASKDAPNDAETVRLGSALTEHSAWNLPESATLPSLKPTTVTDSNAKKIAEGIAKHLPWEDALVERTLTTLDHDFGFGETADEPAVRAGLKPTHKEVKRAVRDFFAEICNHEQLGQFDALLNTPAGEVLQRVVLPWVDKLQVQHDLWADGLRGGTALEIEPSPTTPQPALRAMFEALVPVGAGEGGLRGAKADALAAKFVRGIEAKDLPTVMALLDDDTVKLFIGAYKGVLAYTFASVSAVGVVKLAQSLAGRELKRTKAVLKDTPNDASALRARAIAHGLSNHPVDSLKAFDDLVAAAPTARNYIQRGMQFSLCGQQDRALDDANAALKLAPLSADAYTVRAHILLARDAREDAMRDVTRAMGLALTEAQQQAAAALQEAIMEGFGPDSGSESESDDDDRQGAIEGTHATHERNS